MSETVNCCPQCESSEISPRVDAINEPQPEYDWQCRDCGHRFDEPERREAISEGGCAPRGCPAAILDEADRPEGTIAEWLADGGPAA